MLKPTTTTPSAPLPHRTTWRRRSAWAALWVAVSLTPQAQAAEPAASEPSVFQRVSSAVERGVKAAASGVERGVSAAASGIERGASAAAGGVETGVNATRRAAGTAARKVGLPQAASAPEAASAPAKR